MNEANFHKDPNFINTVTDKEGKQVPIGSSAARMAIRALNTNTPEGVSANTVGEITPAPQTDEISSVGAPGEKVPFSQTTDAGRQKYFDRILNEEPRKKE